MSITKLPVRSDKYDRLVVVAEDLGESIHKAIDEARAAGLNPVWVIGVLESAKYESLMGPMGFEPGDPA